MHWRELKQTKFHIEQVNTHIKVFAKEHKLPATQFMLIDSEVHPAVLSATRKLKILNKPFCSLMKDIKDSITSINRLEKTLSDGVQNNELCQLRNYSFAHIAIWNNDHSGIISFPNLQIVPLPLNDIYHSKFESESCIFPVHASVIKSQVKHDLENGREQSWFPISRGIKKLKQRRLVSTSSFLARYLKFKGGFVNNMPNGAQIIDFLATKMLDLHKPTEFSFMSSVKDMRKMYELHGSETPTSCMDNSHRFGLRDSENATVRPVDFYAYCPITKGACIRRGNIVLSRTICWYDTLNSQWYYGRVYANRTVYSEELIQTLRQLGYKQLSGEYSKFLNYSEAENCTFEIPHSFNDSSSTLCVMPYFDKMPFYKLSIYNTGKVWKCTICFDERKSPEGGKRARAFDEEYPDIRGTAGYHPEGGERNDDDYVYCCNCDEERHVDDTLYVDDVGEYFCDDECAYEHDIFPVYRINGRYQYLSMDTIKESCPDAIKSFGHDLYVSNWNCAITTRDVAVYRPSLFAETEETIFCYANWERPLLSKEQWPVGSAWSNVERPLAFYYNFLSVRTHARGDNKKEVDCPNKAIASSMNEIHFQKYCRDAKGNMTSYPNMLPIDTIKGTSSLAKSFTNKPYQFVKIKENKEALLKFDLDKEISEVTRLFNEKLGTPSRILTDHAPLNYFISNSFTPALLEGEKNE